MSQIYNLDSGSLVGLPQEKQDSGLKSSQDSSQAKLLNQMISSHVYNEMDEVPLKSVDIVEQVETNLSRLVDLQGRVQFMMREIRYLMKI